MMPSNETKNYPKVQLTYAKGEINFTLRGDEKPVEMLKTLQSLVNKYGEWVGAQGEKSAMPAQGGHDSGDPVGTCPDCGALLVYREGKNKKTGRFWQGNFCVDCEYVKWLGQK